MHRIIHLLPFLSWLPRQSGHSLRQDLLVGLSGAILALPQSIAYALIAGLPAEYGLYAAIVPVLVACLWGSSWHLICGPTAAISIVLYASISPLAVAGSADYITLVLLLTFLGGIFQLLLGLLRFGALVNFVSHSVVLGFTLGAAIVIALGQLPNLRHGPAQPGHGPEDHAGPGQPCRRGRPAFPGSGFGHRHDRRGLQALAPALAEPVD